MSLYHDYDHDHDHDHHHHHHPHPPFHRPGSILRSPYIIDCIHKVTLVTPKYGIGNPFWFIPINVQSFGVTGYLWTSQTWMFFGFDPAIIDHVACYGYPTPTPY